VYRLQLINATESPVTIDVKVDGYDMKGLTVEYDQTASTLDPTSNRLLPIRIRVPIEDARQGTHKIDVTVTAETESQRRSQIRQSTSFIVPRNL